MRAKEFIFENPVLDLVKDLRDPKSYDAIDHMMQTIARKHNITGKKLHDLFVAKHGMTPDEFAHKVNETDQSDMQQPPQELQPQQQDQTQQSNSRNVLGAIQTLGRTLKTFQGQDIGAIAKDELLQMLKKKARGEPNQ